MDFNQVEAEYARLNGQFEAGTLTEEQFKSQLHDLMLQDGAGQWWVIGYETGQWYRHDGTDWVRADPPGHIGLGMPQPPDSQPKSAAPKPVTGLTRPGFMNWNPVVLITIGWTVIWGVTWGASALLDMVDFHFHYQMSLLCAALSGLAVGIVLQWSAHPIQWLHIFIMAAGWAIGWVIGFALDSDFFWRIIVWEDPIGINEIINLILVGLLSGSVTGLTIKWADLSTSWQKVIIIAFGWALAMSIGVILSPKIAIISHVISVFVRFAMTGLLIGAIGSGIMFWQLGLLKKTE